MQVFLWRRLKNSKENELKLNLTKLYIHEYKEIASLINNYRNAITKKEM